MIKFKYQIIRSRRKSIEISVSSNGAVIVRCPKETTDHDIETIVNRQSEKIQHHLSKIPKSPARNALSNEDISRLKSEAKIYLPERIAHFADIMGVMPEKVQITSAKKRWGCCIYRQGKYKICFSYRVMLLPKELRDLIVIHELAHILEMNHTAAFYAILDKYEPNHLQLSDSIKSYAAKLPPI